MMRIGYRFTIAVLVGVVVVAGVAQTGVAHQTDRAEHHTEVRTESGEIEQLLQISAADLIHDLGMGHEATPQILEEARDEIFELFAAEVGVRADGEICDLEEAKFVEYPGADGRVHYHQLWQCTPNAQEVTLANRVMIEGHSGYRHVGRIQVGDNVYTTVFDASYPTYSVYPRAIKEASEGQLEESPQKPDLQEEPESQPEPQPESDDDEGGMGISVVEIAVVLALVVLAVMWRRRRRSK